MAAAILLVPLSALVISILSFYFSIKSWRESNRPLITARVSSLGMGGNVAIPLSLVVENTGNRPAKNIQLTVDKTKLESFWQPSHRIRYEGRSKPAFLATALSRYWLMENRSLTASDCSAKMKILLGKLTPALKSR